MVPFNPAIYRFRLLALLVGGTVSIPVLGVDTATDVTSGPDLWPDVVTSTAIIPFIEPPAIAAPELSTATLAQPEQSTATVAAPALEPPVTSTLTQTIPRMTFPTSAGPAFFTATDTQTFVSSSTGSIVSPPALEASSVAWTAPTFSSMTVADPYRWLEDGGSNKVKSWVNSEDRTARDYLAKLPIRKALKHRLSQILDEDEVSVPSDCGWKIVFSRRSANQERPTFYWRSIGQTDDNVLLKPNPRKGEIVGKWSVSPNGNLFAYRLRAPDGHQTALHIRNIESWHEDSRDVIPVIDSAEISWTNDSKAFYYVGFSTDASIPLIERAGLAQVRLHTLGKSYLADPIIFSASHHPAWRLAPSLSSDSLWLFVSVVNGGVSTDIFFKEVRDSSSTFKPLFVSTSATAQVTEWGGSLYIRTNEGAPNYRIVKTYVRQTDPSFWKDLVPERADTIIRSINFIAGNLVLTIMRNTMIGIEVRSLDGALLKTSLDPAPGELSELRGQDNSQCAYFEFSSVVLPRRIYKIAPEEGTIKTWSDPPRPFDDSLYEGTQVTFRSKDGTVVSMDIIKRKGLPLDGSVPFLMEGVGEFGIPATLRFDPMIIAWLEAGGGYALPHLRGGGEYGEAWHHAGMLKQKQNTFDDFIAAAEYLIDHKYTSKERLAIQGDSNSGALVGAVMTQRPDLFRAVVSKAGIYDMIRYPQFGDGEAWIPEYGAPDVEDEFRALLAYSPYHNVKPGTAYPATLLISPDVNDGVDPMHSRKMAAALRDAATSDSLVLLKTERKTGQSSSDSKQLEIEDYVDRLSFLMNAVGMAPSQKSKP